MSEDTTEEIEPTAAYQEDSGMYKKGWENGREAAFSDAKHAAEVSNAKNLEDAYKRGWKNGSLNKDPLSQDYIPEKGDPQWIAIGHMGDHPHGPYLCLLENSEDASEPFHVEERYFTYNSEHRSTFESTEAGKDVVAFMVPRFYPSMKATRERDLQRTIYILRRQLKDAQEERDVYFKTSEEISKATEKSHDVLEDLHKWLESERDDWGCTNKDRTNPFMRTMGKIQDLSTP